MINVYLPNNFGVQRHHPKWYKGDAKISKMKFYSRNNHLSQSSKSSKTNKSIQPQEEFKTQTHKNNRTKQHQPSQFT